ncbi:hypothetical protein BD311DRAFT_9758 [Dichomitus squalens]|uniref:Uncharacterized protein n=1 Tax=Dichomitus squalens TaxID=114155 RepID=A0A4Q9N9D6_9APHY|nr:hypothetical protein BD311DRAFT_9758 [Dichomitus squalens]
MGFWREGLVRQRLECGVSAWSFDLWLASGILGCNSRPRLCSRVCVGTFSLDDGSRLLSRIPGGRSNLGLRSRKLVCDFSMGIGLSLGLTRGRDFGPGAYLFVVLGISTSSRPTPRYGGD